MRVVVVATAALALLAGCSGGGSSNATPPSVPPTQADSSGWSKTSVAAVRTIAQNLEKRVPGGCTGFKVATRGPYLDGAAKRMGAPYPDAVGECTSLTEDLEISVFPSTTVRDDFVNNRSDKICALSKKNNIGLPGLYWVVGGNFSIQPDSEGVSRRVAQAIDATYVPKGCNGTNPGWDPASVVALQQIASKLQKNHAGCADIQMQDRDLVSRTVPFNTIGTPAASANCTLAGGATIVLSAYNSSPSQTETLIKGELSRECVATNMIRIVRTGDIALFTSKPEIADTVKKAVGGSVSPIICKSLN